MSKKSASKQYTTGGQTTSHDIRMFFQINKKVLKICTYSLLFITLGLTIHFVSIEKLKVTFRYQEARILSVMGSKAEIAIPFHGRSYLLPVRAIARNSYFSKVSSEFLGHVVNAFLLALLVSMGIFTLITCYLIYKGHKKGVDDFIRGSRLESPSELSKRIIKDKANSQITIDDFPLIKNSEVQHFLVHGTVGTGKSQLISKLLDHLRACGDRVIIYDKGCSFTSTYFDEHLDVLLNPFDERCANWNLWKEAPKEVDLENLAESLIPMEGESQPFFVHAARDVFSISASKMRTEKDCSLEKLTQFLLTGEFEQMGPYLAGTAAATLVSDKVEKMAISVRAIITTYVKSLLSLSGLDKGNKAPFCIRDYILDEKARGWLFISSNGEKQKSLKPLMSMWLSVASLALLSLPEDRQRRIWFICDELPTLQKLPFLGETIAEVRKFGGCFLLGMQNFSQLAKVYGNKGAGEIFDLLNTRFFFRSPSYEMAKLVSNELGTEEIEEVKESTSYGANSIRDGVSLSKHRVTRALVSYPEIIELPDLTCFLRLPGSYPITKMTLALEVRNQSAIGFIERQLPESVAPHAAQDKSTQKKGSEREEETEDDIKVGKSKKVSQPNKEVLYMD